MPLTKEIETHEEGHDVANDRDKVVNNGGLYDSDLAQLELKDLAEAVHFDAKHDDGCADGL